MPGVRCCGCTPSFRRRNSGLQSYFRSHSRSPGTPQKPYSGTSSTRSPPSSHSGKRRATGAQSWLCKDPFASSEIVFPIFRLRVDKFSYGSGRTTCNHTQTLTRASSPQESSSSSTQQSVVVQEPMRRSRSLFYGRPGKQRGESARAVSVGHANISCLSAGRSSIRERARWVPTEHGWLLLRERRTNADHTESTKATTGKQGGSRPAQQPETKTRRTTRTQLAERNSPDSSSSQHWESSQTALRQITPSLPSSRTHPS